MSAHRVLVRMQAPNGSWWLPGAVVEHVGAPNWKLEPTDPAERERWQAGTAQPERVLDESRRLGIPGSLPDGENTSPPGGVAPPDAMLPPSGPHSVEFS